MALALFIVADGPEAALGEAHLDRAAEIIRAVPEVREALLYRPVVNGPDQPFAKDGRGPALAAELRFAGLPEVEAALTPGRLGRLAVPSLPGAAISHQVFVARDFPVENPWFATPEPCTFLVQYPGPSIDPAAWLDHYDANHPPIMRRFPGVRRVATYRPIAWRSDLAWARGTAMQRNKVAFDSPAALAAALASPVMAEMRADRDTFPAFDGGATHFPMWTRSVV